MEKMNLRDLKKHLSQMHLNEIITDIITLYKDVPAVKEYYLAKLCPDAEPTILEKYKTIIENDFSPIKDLARLGHPSSEKQSVISKKSPNHQTT